MIRRPSRLRTLLPWAGFGLVAVVVVAATTAWASTLRGPDDPLLANATPQAVFVAPAVAAEPTSAAAAVDETTVPTATTRKPIRPTLARAVPPKPAPALVATTTVKPTTAAPTTRPVKTTVKTPAATLNPAESCTGFFCSAPTATNKTPDAATG